MTSATADQPNTTELEAATFRRLRDHLVRQRPEVQNIELMIMAGFCRNCLADWYQQAAESSGQSMTRDQAREAIYGEPFNAWKARHQRPATADQLAAFDGLQKETRKG